MGDGGHDFGQVHAIKPFLCVRYGKIQNDRLGDILPQWIILGIRRYVILIVVGSFGPSVIVEVSIECPVCGLMHQRLLHNTGTSVRITHSGVDENVTGSVAVPPPSPCLVSLHDPNLRYIFQHHVWQSSDICGIQVDDGSGCRFRAKFFVDRELDCYILFIRCFIEVCFDGHPSFPPIVHNLLFDSFVFFILVGRGIVRSDNVLLHKYSPIVRWVPFRER
mmetsp:Transcript_64683/g.75914  ORF Transcript_64683/g.75914 Transcript_64683/m.75914 type:complete len:220 (-) Transcript_64683:219-878(-)